MTGNEAYRILSEMTWEEREKVYILSDMVDLDFVREKARQMVENNDFSFELSDDEKEILTSLGDSEIQHMYENIEEAQYLHGGNAETEDAVARQIEAYIEDKR